MTNYLYLPFQFIFSTSLYSLFFNFVSLFVSFLPLFHKTFLLHHLAYPHLHTYPHIYTLNHQSHVSPAVKREDSMPFYTVTGWRTVCFLPPLTTLSLCGYTNCCESLSFNRAKVSEEAIDCLQVDLFYRHASFWWPCYYWIIWQTVSGELHCVVLSCVA